MKINELALCLCKKEKREPCGLDRGMFAESSGSQLHNYGNDNYLLPFIHTFQAVCLSGAGMDELIREQ